MVYIPHLIPKYSCPKQMSYISNKVSGPGSGYATVGRDRVSTLLHVCEDGRKFSIVLYTLFPSLDSAWKSVILNYGITKNEPKRAKTSQNEPKRAKTSQNEPKRAKTSQNEPKRAKTSQNEPKRPITSQNQL